MSLGFAPPARWQTEVSEITHAPDPHSPVLATTPEATDLDGVSNAWKHVKGVTGDDGKSSDLFELLKDAQKETVYSSQTPGVRTAVSHLFMPPGKML